MIEKVNPKHPDKVADRIAGAIVDLGYKLQENPKISLSKMAKELNVTSRVIERIIRNSNKIKRVGPDKGGHWEIVDKI